MSRDPSCSDCHSPHIKDTALIFLVGSEAVHNETSVRPTIEAEMAEDSSAIHGNPTAFEPDSRLH